MKEQRLFFLQEDHNLRLQDPNPIYIISNRLSSNQWLLFLSKTAIDMKEWMTRSSNLRTYVDHISYAPSGELVIWVPERLSKSHLGTEATPCSLLAYFPLPIKLKSLKMDAAP